MEFFKKKKFIAVLLFIVFLLRLPSLFEPYWYGDEGIYLTVGLAIKQGFLLYRDIFDNKPPLIYLLAALAGGTLFWFRFFLMLSALTTIFFFYKLGENLKLNQKSIKISTIIFSLLSTLPFIEGNIANAEIFILLPTIFSLYLLSPFLFFEKTLPLQKIFAVGAIFGLGFLFKVPAVFDFIPVLIFLTFFKRQSRRIRIAKEQVSLVLGYILPLLVTSFFFLTKNALNTFFNACFWQPIGYLPSWKTQSHAVSLSALFQAGLLLNGFGVFAVVVFLWRKRRAISPLLTFLLLWFILTLFSATLSGRPYPHYLLQITPAVSFLISLLFTKPKPVKKVYFIVGLALFLLTATVLRYRFWIYPTFSYYGNFLKFITRREDKTAYFSFFNSKLPQLYKLAEFIAANSDSQDKIFIWADEPYLYPLSRRLPAVPYTVAYHVIERNLYQKTGEQISQTKPTLIIVNPKTNKFKELDIILSGSYLKIESISDFLVFKRRSP